MSKFITRNIWLLSLVSFFTDAASEMLYPIMPMFLKSIGFSVVLIGVLEGLAEALAGISKGYFGKLSDQSGKRLPFVQLGYSLSAISKPMLALLLYPWWIFIARSVDRLGKGIRTGARDAMLSQESSKENKGKVFGFHRAMDTMGAVLGPSLALLYLYQYPAQYHNLFLLAFIPGVLAILSTLVLKEKKAQNTRQAKDLKLWAIFSYWKPSPAAYKKLLIGLVVFALINSSDVFLLLRAKEMGLSDTPVIGVYIFYNLVFALLAYPLGMLADKWGLKKIFLAGLFIYVAVYAALPHIQNWQTLGLVFFGYGVYAAATEGIAKAWISNLVPATETATAIGSYSGMQSIAALVASAGTGWLWYRFGSSAAFYTTAVVACCVLVWLVLCMKQEKSKEASR